MTAPAIPEPSTEDSQALLAFATDLVFNVDALLAKGVHPKRVTEVLDQIADRTRVTRAKRRSNQ